MFTKGFTKTAKSLLDDGPALDKAGLKMLMVPTAYHAYKGIKDKDKGELGSAAVDAGGLALLHRAVSVSKH
jgi:hypothetical protein